MYQVEIKKQGSNYLVDLILWEKNGYGTAFGRYFGKSYHKAKKVAKNTSNLYNCEIKEVL
tara:strand:+ start:127 stop:306 length:180 start_codon:yes stop_codon:yes gene_type:complete